jgi:hypothetical protein
MEKKPDPMEELEKQHSRSVNRSELKGTTMCQKHRFVKFSDMEVHCQQCPTAYTVENADKFLSEYL